MVYIKIGRIFNAMVKSSENAKMRLETSQYPSLVHQFVPGKNWQGMPNNVHTPI